MVASSIRLDRAAHRCGGTRLLGGRSLPTQAAGFRVRVLADVMTAVAGGAHLATEIFFGIHRILGDLFLIWLGASCLATRSLHQESSGGAGLGSAGYPGARDAWGAS